MAPALTSQVIAADIDGDGDLDLVSASGEEDLVVWYENLLVSGGDSTSVGSAASSSGSSTTATPVPAEATTPAPVVPPAKTTSSGLDENPEEGATPAPSALTSSQEGVDGDGSMKMMPPLSSCCSFRRLLGTPHPCTPLLPVFRRVRSKI